MRKINIASLRNSKKYTIFFVVFIIFLSLFAFISAIAIFLVHNNHKQYSDEFNQTKQSIIINDIKMHVYIASTIDEVRQGLSGRKKMRDDQGMLFLFLDTDYRTFWMKDMLFDIDIIFIRDDTIIDIAKNMPAISGTPWPATYTSKSQADKVLEVNAGLANHYNWQIGDKIVTSY